MTRVHVDVELFPRVVKRKDVSSAWKKPGCDGFYDIDHNQCVWLVVVRPHGRRLFKPIDRVPFQTLRFGVGAVEAWHQLRHALREDHRYDI